MAPVNGVSMDTQNEMNTGAGGFALSPQQARGWEWGRTGGLRISQCVFRIDPGLGVDNLESRLATVVRTQEILRTVFVRPPGLSQPLQVVGAGTGPRIVELDWRGQPACQHTDSLRLVCEQIRTEGFDLVAGPLLAMHLVRVCDEFDWLVITAPALM